MSAQKRRHAGPAAHDRPFYHNKALPAGSSRCEGGRRRRASFAVPRQRPVPLPGRLLRARQVPSGAGARLRAARPGRAGPGGLDLAGTVAGRCLRSRAAGQPAPPAGIRAGRLVYANAGISKATQNREVIAFCDHWKAASGHDPRMLILDQKVTTQPILGELDERGIKFATLRMRSPALMRQISALAPADFKTITLDRPGRHSKPRVHESASVKLTSYPGTVRQLTVTGLGRDAPTVIITSDHDIKTKATFHAASPR